VKKKLAYNEREKIAAEIQDLGSRLYYCSDSGEGRKMRRWIERRIRELERQIEVA
jgi:transcription elongation GreA/GreB family factor